MELTGVKTLPALNVQAPWAALILSGRKTIETRFYPLPAKYINQDMLMVETPGATRTRARIVGIVRFGPSFQYQTRKEFDSDRGRHLVDPRDKVFGWKAVPGKKKWGWPIENVIGLNQPIPDGLRRGIVYTKDVPVHL